MSRARELADLSNVINKGANLQPNLIINGDMAVSQRGTSQTGITINDYAKAPDRYFLSINTLGTWTASQSTTAPDGFSNSYKLECTTADASPAAGDYFLFQQRIEGQNLQVLDSGSANAKKHTLSFWVRSSKTGTYNCEITHVDGSVYNSIQYTIDTADTWERKTLTFDGYQTTAIANDNTSGYRVSWWLGAGTTYTSGTHNSNTWHSTNADRAVGNVNLADSTSNEWYITGVSLVVGDTAPVTHPYESYAENLKRCQRYLYQLDGNLYDHIATGFRNNTNQFWFPLHLPCPLRAAPTYTASNVAIWYGTGGSFSTSIGGVALYAPYGGVMPYNIAPTTFTSISTSITEGIAAFQANGVLQLDAEL